MATERFADFGQGDDPAAVPGGPGSVNSHLRLMTTQLAGLVAPTVNVPNPLGVSGTVSLTMESIEIGKVDQGTGNAGSSPWSISGSVTVTNALSISIPNPLGISGTVTVNQGTSPWAVSGSVTVLNPSSVTIPNPLGVSGTITANAGTGTFITSGGVTVSNFPTTQIVAGAITSNQGVGNAASSPWSVSGSVSVLGTPNVSINNQPLVNQGALSNNSFWSVSGQVSITNTPTVVANAGTGVFSTTVNKVSGTISISNSTTTLLASGAVFTGSAEDVSYYATIGITSYSDVASASGGMSWQFSEDGANWDAKAAYTTTASGLFSVIMPPRPQFFRVVYTNGATAQTNFRLQTIYHPVALYTSTAAPIQDNDPNPSAPRQSSHLMTFNSFEGVWTRARDAISASGSTGRGVLGTGNQVYDSGSAIWRSMLGDSVGRAIISQGIGNAAGSPWSVSGTISVGNTPTVNQGTSPWVVGGPTASGTLFVSPPVMVAGADSGGIIRTILTDSGGRQVVTGTTPNNTALSVTTSGNPFFIGAQDVSNNIQGLKVDTTANPNLRVTIFNGGSQANVANSSVDGVSPVGGLQTNSETYFYNGTNWDRARNSISTVVQASTATATGTTNLAITTYNLTRFMLHANVTVYNGGNVTFTLQYKDANGLFTNIPGATTGPISSGADILLTVGGAPWPSNTTNTFYSSAPITRVLQLQTIVAGATVTFSSAYDLFLA